MSHSLRLFAFILIVLALSASISWSATLYVSDQLVVSLRKGPQASAELIKYLRTDSPVELLEEGEQFNKVKTRDGEIGYILQQYLVKETPKPVTISRLQKEVGRLKQQIKDLEGQLTLASSQGDEAKQTMAAELKTTREQASAAEKELKQVKAELATVSNKFKTLEKNSKDVIGITNERDRLLQVNKEMTEQVAKLEEDRDSLLKTGAIKWFFTGAGVLFFGWILGRMSSSRRRRSAF